MSGMQIHGGGRIVGRGTISAKAICNSTNRAGIITNAHVAGAIHTNLREGVSNNIIGVRRAQHIMQGLADATFVPFANQNAWQMDPSASWLNNPLDHIYEAYAFWRNDPTDFTTAPTTYQVANRAAIQVGQQVAKFGQTTGRTEGIITAIGVTRTVRGFYDGTDRQFIDQIRTNVETLPGDSGSPLFIIEDGRYVLAGTIFAGTFPYDNISLASKITNIIEALDVTIMTQSIFNTHNISDTEVEIVGTTRNLVGNVVLPNNFNDGTRTRTVTSIGPSAFTNQSALSQITLPSTITSLGSNVFNQNTHVHLTEEWTHIPARFFANQSTLSKISILPSITSLGSNVFHQNTHVHLTEDWTHIPAGFFAGQTTLSKILIPATVATIGNNAFQGAIGLRMIANNRATPQVINPTAFLGVNRTNINLIVPVGCRSAYYLSA